MSCLLRDTNPCNLWSQVLEFVPSAFHSMWPRKAGYLGAFLSWPTESKLRGLKVRLSFSANQSSLWKKGLWTDGLFDSFLQSVPLKEREGVFGCVHMDKDNVGFRTCGVFQKPFAFCENLGIWFLGDLNSLFVEDSTTNIGWGLKGVNSVIFFLSCSK